MCVRSLGFILIINIEMHRCRCIYICGRMLACPCCVCLSTDLWSCLCDSEKDIPDTDDREHWAPWFSRSHVSDITVYTSFTKGLLVSLLTTVTTYNLQVVDINLWHVVNLSTKLSNFYSNSIFSNFLLLIHDRVVIKFSTIGCQDVGCPGCDVEERRRGGLFFSCF